MYEKMAAEFMEKHRCSNHRARPLYDDAATSPSCFASSQPLRGAEMILNTTLGGIMKHLLLALALIFSIPAYA
jgi:hypothetical protein